MDCSGSCGTGAASAPLLAASVSTLDRRLQEPSDPQVVRRKAGPLGVLVFQRKGLARIVSFGYTENVNDNDNQSGRIDVAKTLTVQEFAEYVRIPIHSARRLVKEGLVPSRQIGRFYAITERNAEKTLLRLNDKGRIAKSRNGRKVARTPIKK